MPPGLFTLREAGFRPVINICLNCAAEPYQICIMALQGMCCMAITGYCNLIKLDLSNTLTTEGAVRKAGAPACLLVTLSGIKEEGRSGKRQWEDGLSDFSKVTKMCDLKEFLGVVQSICL